jgi:Na+/citrate or Na+/malate symporter
MTIFEFMGNHPYLTFFLAALVCETIVHTARAIRPKCKCKQKEKVEKV